MFQITQTAFLQALGYAIINSLWQFALLWIIYLLINSAGVLRPKTKYSLGLFLEITGFTWFLMTIVFYYQQLHDHGKLVPFFDNPGSLDPILNNASFGSFLALAFAKAEMFLPFLSIAYLLLLIFFGFKWLQAFKTTATLQKSGLEKIDAGLRIFTERVCLQMGIRRPVKIYLSNLVTSPITAGYLKPVILLPFAAVNFLTTDQLEAVILHEIAHIKRYDYLVNLIQTLAEVALFFNPFMQLMSRHIKRERENSCDDWVLQYEYNASSYAYALVKLASVQMPADTGLALRIVDKKHSLLIRVKRMIEKQDRSYNYRNQLVSLLGLAASFAVVAWYTPKAYLSANSVDQKNDPQQTEQKRLTEVADNPLFNPAYFLNKTTRQKLSAQISIATASIETPAFAPQLIAGSDINKVESQANGEKFEFTFDQALPLPDSGTLQKQLSNLVYDRVNFENAIQHINNAIKRIENDLANNKSISQLSDQQSTSHKMATVQLGKQLKKALTEMEASKEELKKLALNNKVLKLKEKVILENQKIAKDFKTAHEVPVEKVMFERNWNDENELDKDEAEGKRFIFFTPHIEQQHIFSYDYKETPRAVTIEKGSSMLSGNETEKKKVAEKTNCTRNYDAKIDSGILALPQSLPELKVRVRKITRI